MYVGELTLDQCKTVKSSARDILSTISRLERQAFEENLSVSSLQDTINEAAVALEGVHTFLQVIETEGISVNA